MASEQTETTKWGVIALATAIGGYFLISSSRLQRFAKEFQITTNVRVQDVSLAGLTLAVDIVFKNPTDARLSLKHPTVYIYNQDPKSGAVPIITSTVENFIYQIQPNAETPLKPVYIKMSYLDSTFLSASWNIIKRYLSSQPITLWSRALTQVNGTIPVEQSQMFILNGKAA